MLPCTVIPPLQSAEKFPAASVAFWLVTVHWKFEQLEKSVSTDAVPAALDTAALSLDATTQVPSSDGAVDVPAAVAVAAEVVLVGPSTLVVRSTLQPDV